MASKISSGTRAAYTRNVLKAFRAASPDDVAAGRGWYDVARSLALEISPDDIARGAGIVAALSPRMTWTGNVNAARACAAGRPFGGLPDNVRKSLAIKDGAAPLDVLGGRKVRAFFACIMAAGDTDAVCVDMHAHDIAIGRVTDNATRATLATDAGYGAIADAYRSAARILAREGIEISPAQVQAVTWVYWRRTRNVDARKAA